MKVSPSNYGCFSRIFFITFEENPMKTTISITPDYTGGTGSAQTTQMAIRLIRPVDYTGGTGSAQTTGQGIGCGDEAIIQGEQVVLRQRTPLPVASTLRLYRGNR